MAKQKVDIASILGAQLSEAAVSDSDTGSQKIEYLDIGKIDPDPNNFYAIDQIDDLASNIQLCGLQQPLLVRPSQPGRYIIISGHRRRAAVQMLVDSGDEQFRSVPCIVAQSDGSPALQELKLILANSDTRQLTSAEIGMQAERVEKLLYQLKEEGMEFPGRMRDHVAEACKVSKTKLANLKMISEKLIPLWSAVWKKNEINMDFAYELSKLPEDYQRKLYDAQMDHRFLYGNTVSSWGDLLKSLDAISCPKGEQCCTNAERMWKRNLKQDYVSKNCDGRYHTAKCCNGCDQLYSCKFACEKFADRIAKHKADEKIRKKDEKQAEQDAAQKKIADATASWARFGEARRAAHVKMSDLVQSAFPEDTKYSLSWRVDDWTKKESGAGIHEMTPDFTSNLSRKELLSIADLLHCSIDYLYCITDDPQPFTGAWKKASDEHPDEGRFLFVIDAMGDMMLSVFWDGTYMDYTPRSTANVVLKNIHWWMYQPAMPGNLKRTGEETLKEMMRERGKDDA